MRGFLLIVFCLLLAVGWMMWRLNQDHIYQQMLERLQAESRAAQVLVTAVNYDEKRR